MNKRKYPVELTDEERRMHVEARVDYSNRMNWKFLFIFVAYLAYAVVAVGFLPLYVQYIIEGDWSGLRVHLLQLLSALPVAWWLLLFIAFFLPALILFCRSANKYILEGDTLIVRERTLFKLEDELRIPVASISKLYVKNRWALSPLLYLEVDGVPRQLQSDTYVNELAVGILQRQ